MPGFPLLYYNTITSYYTITKNTLKMILQRSNNGLTRIKEMKTDKTREILEVRSIQQQLQQHLWHLVSARAATSRKFINTCIIRANQTPNPIIGCFMKLHYFYINNYKNFVFYNFFFII